MSSDDAPSASFTAQAPTEEAPTDETPVQRALRLKKAALDNRPKPPRGGRFQREQNARIAAGKSRPWMSK